MAFPYFFYNDNYWISFSSCPGDSCRALSFILYFRMTLILGISSFYHDSAASLISDGVILSAVQEERFTRVKHDASFPINSIKWILKTNSLKLEDIDYIVFYDKPFIKFDRLVETYIDQAPFGFKSFKLAMPHLA